LSLTNWCNSSTLSSTPDILFSTCSTLFPDFQLRFLFVILSFSISRIHFEFFRISISNPSFISFSVFLIHSSVCLNYLWVQLVIHLFSLWIYLVTHTYALGNHWWVWSLFFFNLLDDFCSFSLWFKAFILVWLRECWCLVSLCFCIGIYACVSVFIGVSNSGSL
jgi:hypothetical protein